MRRFSCIEALSHGVTSRSCVGGVDNRNRDGVWEILTSVPIFSELDPVFPSCISSTVTLLYCLTSSCMAPLGCPSLSLPHAWPNLREEENEMTKSTFSVEYRGHLRIKNHLEPMLIGLFVTLVLRFFHLFSGNLGFVTKSGMLHLR